MRVVYLIPGMSGAGGAERSLAAMVPFLAPAVDLHIVTWNGQDELRSDIEGAGATLTDLAVGGRPALFLELRRVISRLKPDLIHTTLIDADVVGRPVGLSNMVPVVSSLVNVNHGISVMRSGAGRWDKRLLAWSVDAATARSVVRFHALTEHVASTMSRRLGVPRSRIEVIPRGRDPQVLGRRTPSRRRAAREALGVHDDRPLIVAAARHEHQKGLDVLLRAVPLIAHEYPDVRVLIGGREGNASSELRELVAQLHLDGVVALLGQRDDVATLMSAADVWCVPSRWEGLGSILVEAMCLEVPVVASAVPAICEIAGDPAAFTLVQPDDPNALARGVLDVLSNPAFAEQRSTIAYGRFLSEFTADDIAQRMIGFYERSLASSRIANSRKGGRAFTG